MIIIINLNHTKLLRHALLQQRVEKKKKVYCDEQYTWRKKARDDLCMNVSIVVRKQ